MIGPTRFARLSHVAFAVGIWGKADRGLRRKCLLMTQSGHRAIQKLRFVTSNSGPELGIAQWSNFSLRSITDIIIPLAGLTLEVTRPSPRECFLLAQSGQSGRAVASTGGRYA